MELASRAMSTSPARPRLRPFDLLLVAFFTVSIAYGFAVSLPEGLGLPVTADSPWPPLRSLHGWAVEQEPAHLDPPAGLVASCLFDGLFQAPLLCFLVVGLVRRRRWPRGPALVYAGAGTTNMFFYLFETFLGPHPPLHLAVYVPFNLPWALAPVLLGLRVRRAPGGPP